jgi:hypothetical protein
MPLEGQRSHEFEGARLQPCHNPATTDSALAAEVRLTLHRYAKHAATTHDGKYFFKNSPKSACQAPPHPEYHKTPIPIADFSSNNLA